MDAIGGSSAGVYINNKVRVASLFRGVTDPVLFDGKVKDMFLDVAKEWSAIECPLPQDRLSVQGA